MPTLEVNIVAAPGHVTEIEHGILFIKKSCRGTWDNILFRQTPKSFVIHLSA